MIYTELTKKAMNIAFNAHKNQLDKGGYPYIAHPIHLAEQMDNEIAAIVALLHDVVEDTDWTMEDLEKEGFPPEVTDALKLLTHNDGSAYMDYVQRIADSNNMYAKQVKLADLRHNSDLSRLSAVDGKALARIEKYTKAIAILEDSLKAN
jgi:guanosine-3',5'-bis(diphosphate) 3'-pyrophosphohydrolase